MGIPNDSEETLAVAECCPHSNVVKLFHGHILDLSDPRVGAKEDGADLKDFGSIFAGAESWKFWSPPVLLSVTVHFYKNGKSHMSAPRT